MADKRNSGCRDLGAGVEQDGITFSAAVYSEEPVSLILYHKGSEEVAWEIPFPDWPCAGIVYSMKVPGISPKKYEYNFRIGKKVVQDPAARLVVGRKEFGDLSDRGEHQVRCGFLSERFDWGEEERLLHIRYEDVIAYQLHVRGFTKQKNSRVRHKGTFLGLQEKIPYLKELGVNQVILMPAYEFDEVILDNRVGTVFPQNPGLQPGGSIAAGNGVAISSVGGKRLNYWGYGEGFYYAPKTSYCATNKPDIEFKTMVKKLHENGIEVIMEFSFPDPVDITMAADCLNWWQQEYHVDGFLLRMRQDAANALAGNPFLMGCKLYSDYFPVDTVYPGNRKIKGRNLAECNDGFKITARKLLKGDEDQLSDFVRRTRYNPPKAGVMNYITGHDGFTLMDLVSYDKKHNEDNGEQGRDGAVYNYSWNCGLEGPTKKKSITKLRMQQMKNAFAMMLLAQGTPMLLAGDEFGNSQMGNNNPYCLDNEVTWVDWSRERANRELTEFVKTLIRFRKEHKILHMERELTGMDMKACGYPDVSCHGSRAWYGAFEHMNRHVGLLYCGMYAECREFVYVVYNLHWNPQEIALPNLAEGMRWKKVLDTSASSEEEETQDIKEGSKEFIIPPRCVQVLLAKPIPGAKRQGRNSKAE